MSTLTHPIPTDPVLDGIPVEELGRLSPEQFDVALKAGVFPPEDRVELVDGLLRRGGGGSEGFPYRLSLDQYHRMEEVGALTTNDRVELLGGWLVTKMPINPPHRFVTFQTRSELARIIPAGYYVDQDAPSSLPRTDTEPQPDVQAIRGCSRDFSQRHPGPADIALFVEVSDSTIRSDRNYKWRLYAREGIPVYWIVNLAARRVEVYTDPSGPGDEPGYRHNQFYGPEDEVPLVLDGREVGRIAVNDLLP